MGTELSPRGITYDLSDILWGFFWTDSRIVYTFSFLSCAFMFGVVKKPQKLSVKHFVHNACVRLLELMLPQSLYTYI